MSLHTQIKGELKDALKTHNEARLRTVRSMLTAFTNELVATGKTPQSEFDDESVLKVISRLAKQRKDSIQQFESGNRNDLANIEKEELVILESYLPELMSEEELRPVINAKIKELGVTDKSKVGLIIGSLMKDLKGKADGALVKTIAESLLS